MTDRTTRFAARMIAVGLLGVAWAIATLTMVVVQQTAASGWQMKLMGYLGMAPVAVLLLYVVLTDCADWQSSRKAKPAAGADGSPRP